MQRDLIYRRILRDASRVVISFYLVRFSAYAVSMKNTLIRSVSAYNVPLLPYNPYTWYYLHLVTILHWKHSSTRGNFTFLSSVFHHYFCRCFLRYFRTGLCRNWRTTNAHAIIIPYLYEDNQKQTKPRQRKLFRPLNTVTSVITE